LIHYFPTVGDRHGWAIDEDRRLIRRALEGAASESPVWRADVVHAPFWMALSMHHPQLLRDKFVMAHADNPPFFYLTQPEFLSAQQAVDLWVARSREAMEQFAALRLPAVHVPYAIDESMFFPIEDRAGLRSKYGIPRDAYVVGNFHRDSEGTDLTQPKLQKAPETLVAILRLVRARGYAPHVLLAGPRRHWIRAALQREGIPFTFVGKADLPGDDFGVNILARPQLNELYNACDVYLVPSRWEGGPQSAMEAAAAATKILSYPLGVARDLLEPASLFDTPLEAAQKIADDIKSDSLARTLPAQRRKLLADHTSQAMARGIRGIYASLDGSVTRLSPRRAFGHAALECAWQISRRRRRSPRSARLQHVKGRDPFMDEVVANLHALLADAALAPNGHEDGVTIAGQAGGSSRFRLLPPGGEDRYPADGACRIALSAQDAVNFKSGGQKAPVLVCPLVFGDGEQNGECLVVDQGNANASLDVWRCINRGGYVVYPRDKPYYYQAFHAGIPYDGNRSVDEARLAGFEESDGLRQLGRPNSRSRARAFWERLLSQ